MARVIARVIAKFSASVLNQVPGIDGEIATAIVADRDAKEGGVRFKSLEDLKASEKLFDIDPNLNPDHT